MTGGQWFGVAIALVGVYFVVCASWAREFVLYRLKIERATMIMNEGVAHVFYFVLGVLLIVGGGLQALKIWVVN
jgi:hypothetical protein